MRVCKGVHVLKAFQTAGSVGAAHLLSVILCSHARALKGQTATIFCMYCSGCSQFCLVHGLVLTALSQTERQVQMLPEVGLKPRSHKHTGQAPSSLVLALYKEVSAAFCQVH